MRLIGAPRLFEDGGIPAEVRGACAALLSELEAGQWCSRAETSVAFPSASWSGNEMVVTLSEQVCAVVNFNFRAEIALVGSLKRLAKPALVKAHDQERRA